MCPDPARFAALVAVRIFLDFPSHRMASRNSRGTSGRTLPPKPGTFAPYVAATIAAARVPVATAEEVLCPLVQLGASDAAALIAPSSKVLMQLFTLLESA